jgi:hypothetical protein
MMSTFLFIPSIHSSHIILFCRNQRVIHETDPAISENSENVKVRRDNNKKENCILFLKW